MNSLKEFTEISTTTGRDEDKGETLYQRLRTLALSLSVILSLRATAFIKWLGDTARMTRRQAARGAAGQATLEWVLIGGILVVIIVGLLMTVFKPTLDTIMTNILQMVQTNTSGGATS